MNNLLHTVFCKVEGVQKNYSSAQQKQENYFFTCFVHILVHLGDVILLVLFMVYDEKPACTFLNLVNKQKLL